ncbi:hypothetical protein AKJ16_DCAP21607 [Drosera capensis]
MMLSVDAATTTSVRPLFHGAAAPPLRPPFSSFQSPIPYPYLNLSSSSSLSLSRSSSQRRFVSRTRRKWLCGCTSDSQKADKMRNEETGNVQSLGSDAGTGFDIPSQGQSVLEPPTELQTLTDEVDYIQEFLAIQQGGPRTIGFFGTRNMGFMHQELIEILSYALVITKNHIYTSGASGTNAAVIRGALRAERPDLLTVILPQSLNKQPPESQELLAKVKNVIEKPDNDSLTLLEASRLCNMDIISRVRQVICFAFHDSKLLMETCQEAKNMRKIVTLFYLD